MGKKKSLLRRFLDKLDLPTLEIAPEREEKIIEGIVDVVSRYAMEAPVIFVGSGFVPVAKIFSQTVFIPFATFLEILGLRGFEIQAFLSNPGNLRKVIERLEKALEDRASQRKSFWDM